MNEEREQEKQCKKKKEKLLVCYGEEENKKEKRRKKTVKTNKPTVIREPALIPCETLRVGAQPQHNMKIRQRKHAKCLSFTQWVKEWQYTPFIQVSDGV